MRLLVAVSLVAVLAAAACDADGGAAPTATLAPTSTPMPATAAVTPTQDELRPADSEFPAAGACLEPAEGNVVTWTINPDVPSPRCSQVRPEQHVSFVNATDEPVQILFPPHEFTIGPGETEEINEPAGSYLAPGVHVARTSTYGGESGPEVWLLE